MDPAQHRRAAIKIRALRVSFRSALLGIEDLPPHERSIALSAILTRGMDILRHIRAEMHEVDGDLDAIETEIESCRKGA